MSEPHQPFTAFTIQHTGILTSFQLQREAKQEKLFHLDATAGKNRPAAKKPLRKPMIRFLTPVPATRFPGTTVRKINDRCSAWCLPSNGPNAGTNSVSMRIVL